MVCCSENVSHDEQGRRHIRYAAVLLLLCCTAALTGCQHRRVPSVEAIAPCHAVATMATPLFNSPDLRRVFGGADGTRLALDRVELIREVEMVCLPQTPFRIDGKATNFGRTVYRVTTPDYPYPRARGYFVDGACLKLVDNVPPPRPKRLRHPLFIRYKLMASLGAVYLWGGNWRAGIPEWVDWYPPARSRRLGQHSYYARSYIAHAWQFRGVDCSGLIYEATDGWTPRNASSLIRYGRSVPIAGLSPHEICKRVEPLDILGWRTHVMIFLDQQHIIQSRVDYDYDTPGNQGGVRIQEAEPYLTRLMKSYDPVDDYDDDVPAGRNKFVIRRWYGMESRAR